MMAADTMEALGIARGSYVLKVNSRKTMDALLAAAGIDPAGDSEKRLIVLRAMDKLDRLGLDGVRLLLGKGRKDESGDFTKGAELEPAAVDRIIAYLSARSAVGNAETISNIEKVIKLDPVTDGLAELRAIAELATHSGYGTDRILIDPSVVRGLEYYTGAVFECELLMETKDEDGNTVRFGSVGGGGRYDDLVARFTGQSTPATGFSIGVSRLYSALKLVGKATTQDTLAPVVVTVMDKDRQGDYWRMVQALRNAGIRAEMALGAANMGKQMKYADKRGSPLVVIQGGDEKAKGEVTIKDLRLGSELAANIASREEYASQRLAQVSVPEAELVAQVKKMLG
jgi:histidyl-tRNA synthetase